MTEELDKVKEKLLDFARESYNFEMQQKNNINSRLALVLTAISVLFGAAAFFINTTNFAEFTILKYCFLTFLAGAFGVLLFALYYYYKCLFTYKYRYVETPNRINKHIQNVITYNADMEKWNTESVGVEKKETVNILNEYNDLLFEHYSSSIDKSRENNIRKNVYFIKTLQSLFIASLLLIVTAGFYHVERICDTNKLKSQRKETIEMAKEENIFNVNPKEEIATPSTTNEPVRPIRPEPVDITEAEMPKNDIRTKSSDMGGKK